MHILNIETPIISSQEHEVRKIKFFSNTTFLDADLIFWDIQKSSSELPGGPNISITQNATSISNLEKIIERRKKELDEFFNIGRTLIIINPFFNERKYKLPTGEKIVGSLNFLDCLDIEAPEISSITGKNIQTVEESFIQSYYNSTKSYFSYNLRIDKSNGIPLFFIKDTNYVVAEFYRIKKGYLVILPEIDLSLQHANHNFLHNTTELIKNLTNYNHPSEIILPDWTEKYVLQPEQKELEKEKNLKDKLKKLESELENNKKELDNLKFLKTLFSSTGTALEEAVRFVLEDMGYQLEETKLNRDDLIIKLGKKRAVIEIKGLTKSAAEKNAAQLQKWVSTYHSEFDINPKGILIANTFKNVKLENRTEKDFPNQMLPYAKQMKHCLISGIQLLNIYLDFKEKKVSKKEIDKLLFETVGVLTYKKNVLENFIIK